MGTETTAELAELIGVRDVATITSLAPRTIWRYRDAGYLPPPIKIGTAVRWRRSDIEAWIADGCRPVRHVSRGGGR